jgi:glutathione S-transferase
MGLNVRKRYPGRGRTPEVLDDIRRIDAIWSQAKGPFLFGPFSAADAMYAPVVLRFRTYEVRVSNRDYLEAMLALPAMKEWVEAAEREPESIPQYDLAE